VSAQDAQLLESTLRSFRKKRIEGEWERIDGPDAARYAGLWQGLEEIGITTLGLPEGTSGLDLDAAGRFAILRELGAAAPALGFGLIAHVTAVSMLCETAGKLPPELEAASSGARFALAASPLDAHPATAFDLDVDGMLSGSQRVALAYPDWIVVPARDGDRIALCAVRVDAAGVRFSTSESSHGLRLVRFGELTLDHAMPRAHVFAWPDSGRAAQEADGLLTSLLAGLTGELADLAMRYALQRYQGGKMICEHDAVRQLVGPIELARRGLRALALDALAARRRGDGGASAFAIDLVRRSALDAIQTFGGYGYMEDYRVERYLRDANTLETFWIHAAARQRDIARARFAELASS
jgi:isovaleryl-CoA dehydrogenase